jgi:hypothetical protein
MKRIAIAELTSKAFAPFGEVGASRVEGGKAPLDVALDLSRRTPRFYIMRLAQRGLEMVDTNIADYIVWRLYEPVEFAT